ncbi:homeobox protein BarH-like 2 [Nematostella vectensis]|nr:homeobox protein BarH-like 2 [Nematostella vectensis]
MASEQNPKPRLAFSIENILRDDFPRASKIVQRPCFFQYPVFHNAISSDNYYTARLGLTGSLSCYLGSTTPRSRENNVTKGIRSPRSPGQATSAKTNRRQNPSTTVKEEAKGSSPNKPTPKPQSDSKHEQSTPDKKKKRHRSHFSQLQLQYLDAIFARQHYLSRDERTVLAGALDMTELQVRNWFQNKRYQRRNREQQAIQKLAKQVPVKVLVNEGVHVTRPLPIAASRESVATERRQAVADEENFSANRCQQIPNSHESEAVSHCQPITMVQQSEMASSQGETETKC